MSARLVATFDAAAAEVARTFRNALLFADSDKWKGEYTRPVLASVRVRFAGGLVTVEATDAYALIRERLDVESPTGQATTEALVPVDVATEIVRAAKKDKGGRVSARLYEDGSSRWEAWQATFTHAPVDGKYPDTDTLCEASKNGSKPASRILVAAWQWKRIGQIVLHDEERDGSESLGGPLLLNVMEGTKASRFVSPKERIEGLVMPLREEVPA